MTEKKKNPRVFTAKTQAFINEYPIDKNATQAAIRAGFSEKTAYSAGQRLLKDVDVKAEIDRKLQKVAKKNDVTLERVIKEYARIAFMDPRRLLDENGKPVPLQHLDDDTAAAVSRVRVRGRNQSLALYDKTKALTDLMRHLGGFSKDEVGIRAGEGLAELLNAATNKGHKLPGSGE